MRADLSAIRGLMDQGTTVPTVREVMSEEVHILPVSSLVPEYRDTLIILLDSAGRPSAVIGPEGPQEPRMVAPDASAEDLWATRDGMDLLAGRAYCLVVVAGDEVFGIVTADVLDALLATDPLEQDLIPAGDRPEPARGNGDRRHVAAGSQLGDAGGEGAVPTVGAGPGDTAPPAEPAMLIDDLPPAMEQPVVAWRETQTVTTTAWPHLDAPAAVVAGRPFQVTVGLGEQRDPKLDGTGPLVLPAADFTLGVELLIDSFVIVGNRMFTLEATAEDRYPKQTVMLVAVAGANLADRRRIGVIFRVGREMRGYAGREIIVEATEADAARVSATVTSAGPAGIDTSPFRTPDAADLTVVIQHGDAADGSRLIWSAASPHTDIPLPPVAVGPPLASSAEQFLQELVAEASSTTDILDLFASLRGRGKAAIAPLIPGFVKEALHRVAQVVAPRLPTVLLLSQDPYVPWELAVLDPSLPGWPADGSPFLGAQAVIGRWVLAIEPPPAVDPPKHVTVRDEAVVTGVYVGVPDWRRLASAEHEAAELRKRWPAAHAVDAELPAVLDCLGGRPGADIIHFALHGEFSTETARQGLILIGSVEGHPDQRCPVFLKPSHVDGGKLTRSPLVFLNACQVGAGRLVLGNYSGMASAFVRAGASAVIAPLWSVNDEVASAIALDFYTRALDASERPAEVLRANRARVTESVIKSRDRNASGTYLAYQFFGHPNLRLAEALLTRRGNHECSATCGRARGRYRRCLDRQSRTAGQGRCPASGSGRASRRRLGARRARRGARPHWHARAAHHRHSRPFHGYHRAHDRNLPLD